jgi:hypothetical protein
VKACPDCESEMVEGCRRDKFNVATASPESWVLNKPRKKLPILLTPNGLPIPIVTYACMECGRLVSYLKKD